MRQPRCEPSLARIQSPCSFLYFSIHCPAAGLRAQCFLSASFTPCSCLSSTRMGPYPHSIIQPPTWSPQARCGTGPRACRGHSICLAAASGLPAGPAPSACRPPPVQAQDDSSNHVCFSHFSTHHPTPQLLHLETGDKEKHLF